MNRKQLATPATDNWMREAIHKEKKMGDLLGGIAGAAMGAVAPEMGILNVVAKGLELAEGLLGKSDTKDVGKILDLLSQMINQLGGGAKGAAPAADPQPFDNPADNGLGMGGSSSGGEGAGGAASSMTEAAHGIHVNVTVNEGIGDGKQATAVSHPK